MIDGKISKLSDFTKLAAGTYRISGSDLVSHPDYPQTSKLVDFDFTVTIIPRYGDSNGDAKVSIADAVLIMQYIANQDQYGVNGTDPNHITAQGEINADCYNNGDGITSKDALTVQKYLVNLINSLPDNQ